jgi:hypothetical protein
MIVTAAGDHCTVRKAAALSQAWSVAHPAEKTPIFTVYVPAACPAGTAHVHWNVRLCPAANAWLPVTCWCTRAPPAVYTSRSTMIPLAGPPPFVTTVWIVVPVPRVTGFGVAPVGPIAKLGGPVPPPPVNVAVTVVLAVSVTVQPPVPPQPPPDHPPNVDPAPGAAVNVTAVPLG